MGSSNRIGGRSESFRKRQIHIADGLVDLHLGLTKQCQMTGS
jgi:hypothetical protein